MVLKLGSGATFSSGLLALQQEVGPLYSIPNCPRDFIRTSVERVFRDRGFLVDWCKFLLVSNILLLTTFSIFSDYSQNRLIQSRDKIKSSQNSWKLLPIFKKKIIGQNFLIIGNPSSIEKTFRKDLTGKIW